VLPCLAPWLSPPGGDTDTADWTVLVTEEDLGGADSDNSSKSSFTTDQELDQGSSRACEQVQLALAEASVHLETDSTGQQAHQLGLLFHAAEYPAFQEDAFPIHLGYCQEGSTLEWDVTRMDLRNILWYQVSEAPKVCLLPALTASLGVMM
jgi:hypothetical protein